MQTCSILLVSYIEPQAARNLLPSMTIEVVLYNNLYLQEQQVHAAYIYE